VTERLSDRTSPAFPGEAWTQLDTYPGQVVRFDGRTALAYVRSRLQSSDYRRMIRQRCFLTAVADQLDPVAAIRHLGKLSRAAKQYVTTGVPLDRLPNLIELVSGINPWLSTGVSFTPPQYDAYRPDVQPYRDTVRRVLLTPPDKLLRQYDLRSLAGSCRDGD
jgi:LytR_cpsA_psr family